MQVTGIYFYFLSMAVLIAQGAVLSKVLPTRWKVGGNINERGRVMTLDGLRGILALSVFLHHCVIYYYRVTNGSWAEAPSNFYAQMGVMPVTMFFFITGYLFWMKLTRRGSIPFRQFLNDRLARLGGAYWAACVLFFFIVAWGSKSYRHVNRAMLVAQCVAWLSFLGAGHDFDGVQGSTRLLGQVWTLRMEWMYYLSLPFLGWFAVKRMRLFLLLGSAAVTSFIIGRVTFGGVPNYLWKTLGEYLYFLSVTFSVGMLVAIVPASARIKKLAQSVTATAVSAPLLLITALIAPANYGLLESLLLAVPFACICFGNTWFGLLVSGPVRLLGQVSYSFYLLHSLVLYIGFFLLLRFVPHSFLSPVHYWLYSGACGAVAVVVSCISWRYLERPFLKGAPRRANEPGDVQMRHSRVHVPGQPSDGWVQENMFTSLLTRTAAYLRRS